MTKLFTYLTIALAQVLLVVLAVMFGTWLLGGELSTHTILPWRV